MTNEELIAKATSFGREAYHRGDIRIASSDKNLTTLLLQETGTDFHDRAYRAWFRGWDLSNIASPVMSMPRR